jgi:GxxExxY protein
VEINQITGSSIDAAMEVHSILGPGLLEAAYENALKHELMLRNIHVANQVLLPVTYKDQTTDIGYRLDLLVEDSVIVEVKSVQSLLPLHEAQLLSYLKMSNKKIGLLINFNVPRLKHGIKRLAN